MKIRITNNKNQKKNKNVFGSVSAFTTFASLLRSKGPVA